MADEEAPVNPQEQAADNKIQDFRTTFSEALLDTSHVEHSRRANELKAMYEARFASERPVFDPSDGVRRPEDSVDQIASEEMQPLRADQFEIGEDDAFGLNVDKAAFGWDKNLEIEARQTFATAALNNAQARTVATSYYEAIQPTFNVGEANRQSTELLKHQYGDQNVERALTATNAMLRKLAGPQLFSYIGRSGLGANPKFVGECVRVARARGWWK